jgi:hypothetical protein
MKPLTRSYILQTNRQTSKIVTLQLCLCSPETEIHFSIYCSDLDNVRLSVKVPCEFKIVLIWCVLDEFWVFRPIATME